MITFVNNDLLLSLGIFLLLGLMLAKNRRLARKITAMEFRLEALAVDMEALYAGTRSLDQVLANMNKRIEKTSPHPDVNVSNTVRDLPVGGYNSAIRMIRHGATIDDLVEKCGVSKSEAQLLYAIHTARKTASIELQ